MPGRLIKVTRTLDITENFDKALAKLMFEYQLSIIGVNSDDGCVIPIGETEKQLISFIKEAMQRSFILGKEASHDT